MGPHWCDGPMGLAAQHDGAATGGRTVTDGVRVIRRGSARPKVVVDAALSGDLSVGRRAARYRDGRFVTEVGLSGVDLGGLVAAAWVWAGALGGPALVARVRQVGADGRVSGDDVALCFLCAAEVRRRRREGVLVAGFPAGLWRYAAVGTCGDADRRAGVPRRGRGAREPAADAGAARG